MGGHSFNFLMILCIINKLTTIAKTTLLLPFLFSPIPNAILYQSEIANQNNLYSQ